LEVYEILEPLMKDFRKLRLQHVGGCGEWARLMAGGYELTYFDEFIDELLTKDRVCDIILPRLTQRAVLEDTEGLHPRKSLLVGATTTKLTAGGRARARIAQGQASKALFSDTIPHTVISRLVARFAARKINVERQRAVHVALAVRGEWIRGGGRKGGHARAIRLEKPEYQSGSGIGPRRQAGRGRVACVMTLWDLPPLVALQEIAAARGKTSK
jgi:hypothetical protein